MINYIVFLSSFLFLIGLSAQFRGLNNSSKRKGTIIIFVSCILNYTAFSNLKTVSIEGQVISLLILLIASLHYFIQKNLIASDD